MVQLCLRLKKYLPPVGVEPWTARLASQRLNNGANGTPASPKSAHTRSSMKHPSKHTRYIYTSI